MNHTDMVIAAAWRGNLSRDLRILSAARTMEAKGLIKITYADSNPDYFAVRLTDKGLRAYGRRRPQEAPDG
jgi:hypothetical protein